MELDGFRRVYLEVWHDGDDYTLIPEKCVRYDDGRRAFVIEEYFGSDLYSVEYEPGLFLRPENWGNAVEVPAEHVLGLVASLDEGRSLLPDGEIESCEEEGLYWCVLRRRPRRPKTN